MEPFTGREERTNSDKMVACADENVEIDLLKRKRSAIRSVLTGKDSGADLFSIRIANCPVVDKDIPGVKTSE